MDAVKLYSFLPNLLEEIPDIPKDGILSRTVFRTDGLKAVIFAFDAGQELTEHTSTHTAILHILRGEAQIRLGEDSYEAQTHSWAYLPPRLPHAIIATSPLVMLLIMEEGK